MMYALTNMICYYSGKSTENNPLNLRSFSLFFLLHQLKLSLKSINYTGSTQCLESKMISCRTELTAVEKYFLLSQWKKDFEFTTT